LLAAIDEALSSLGESVKTSIYFHLAESFNIKREEIPRRINEFSNGLERIFGMGAKQLEILFMKNLHAKIGVTCEWPTFKWIIPDVTFQEYVDLMKQNYVDTGKKEEIEVMVDAYEKESIR
jgi:hypothetical protein